MLTLLCMTFQRPLDLSMRRIPSPASSDVSSDENTLGSSPCPVSDIIVPDNVTCNVTRQRGDVSVSLVDANVWEAFSGIGTEMIINRNGRYG